MALTMGGGITIGGAITVQLEFPPGAPTIGTATATGATTATVTFTAPSNAGSSTITSYTATSSPGGITGTLNQAGSGTITVTGLSEATSYTFTITATNSVGTSSPSVASNSITTPQTVPTVIGQAFGGGYYAGKISTSGNGVATHYLIIGPAESAQSFLFWKTSSTNTPGTNSVIDGPTNTSNMNNSLHPAAQFCKGLTVGGYTDWYMPAQNELEVCYYNLKPTSYNNNTNSGMNSNSVPPEPYQSFYTNSSPGVTSATDFQSGGSQAFVSNIYWSSTQNSSGDGSAWRQFFLNGQQTSTSKSNEYYVRAVRRIPI